VPASPELALVPDSFDVIETEVIEEHDGVLTYNLSLSAKPTHPVVVVVTPDIRSPFCYGYEPKFTLKKNTFEFTSETHDINQTVVITVNNVNASKYEGTFSASFHHTLVTEDEGFKSAFLRPVLVALQDDSLCFDGSEKYEQIYADRTRVRKCGCRKGFYIQAADLLFCDSVTTCLPCPTGMACGFQQDMSTANIAEGYYRHNATSPTVTKCPVPNVCVGNSTAGDTLCAEGHQGPFCMICTINSAERYVWSGGKCKKCSATSEASLYAVIGGIGFLCIGSVWFIARTKKQKKSAGQKKSKFNTERMEAFADKFQTKYKILITFTQILTKITTLYPIDLPNLFKSFWGKFNLLAVDVSVLPLNCVVDSNFHSRLVATTLFPIVFVCGIAVVWIIQRQRILSKGGDDLRASLSMLSSQSIRLCVMFLFTVFPMVSTAIFQTFRYDERLNDGTAYLVADYSIQKNDPVHQGYIIYAALMAVLYCFGIPATSWVALNSKREQIQKLQLLAESIEELEKGGTSTSNKSTNASQRKKSLMHQDLVANATRRFSGVGVELDGAAGSTLKAKLLKLEVSMKENDPWLAGLSPLYKDYDFAHWWFEIPKFIATLILCGLVTLIPAEGASQVFISLITSMGMMVLFANSGPYLSKSDDILAQFCQFSLTFALTIGLLEKASDSFQDAVFGPLLVISTSVNLGLGVLVIVSDFVTTAIPDTIENAAARLTVVRSSNSKIKMTRKTVVAPFINDATTLVETRVNKATVLGVDIDSSIGPEPVQCRPGIEYLKLVTLGCGVTMDDFVEALTENARVQHQIVHSDNELAQLLSSNDQTVEGVAAALLNDLQERLGTREYDEHNLLEIAVCQKRKQVTAVAPRGPSFPIAADASLQRGPRIETVVKAKGLAKKARKSTAKRAEL
jgi:hypothetical protein